MKVWTIVVASLVVGVGLGAGLGIARAKTHPWPGQPLVLGGRLDVATTYASVDEPRPKVVVDEEEYQFGSMDLGAELRHDFTIRNAGEKPLVLTLGSTTCKCTLSDLKNGTVPPGESTTVALTWHSTTVGKFEQTAHVNTNDPYLPQIKLMVSGRVTTAVRADPSEVDFIRISPKEEQNREFRLYVYQKEPVEVLEAKVAQQEFSDMFSVTYVPLTAEQIAEEQDAKSGYLFTVQLKPGLPLGPIQQKVALRLSVATRPSLDVPIRGHVGSGISVYGQGWDAEKTRLRLGLVSSREGCERKLLVVVHGTQPEQVQFKVARVDPDFLNVEIGKTVAVGDGAVNQTPIAIRIPKGTPPMNRTGSDQGGTGEILLETNLEESPQLRIPVSFAVGE